MINPNRQLLFITAISIWLASLVLLIPYGPASFALVYVFVLVSAFTDGRARLSPEIEWIFWNSYWIGLVVFLLASIAIVSSAGKYKPTVLRVIALADLAILTLSLCMLFVQVFVFHWPLR